MEADPSSPHLAWGLKSRANVFWCYLWRFLKKRTLLDPRDMRDFRKAVTYLQLGIICILRPMWCKISFI